MENLNEVQGNFWRKIIAACVILLTAGCAVKIALSTMSVTIDFATLLSVLLALFSVALSVLFYFKATETSNAFYDNTYKYTKDIAELLVRIEASFGEKLTHLDAGYRSLVESQKHIHNTPQIKANLEQEKAELEKVLEDRTKIIDELIENSHLESEEKARITEELKAKDQELEDLNRHVNRLKAEMRLARGQTSSGKWVKKEIKDAGFRSYTLSKVIEVLGSDLIHDAGTRELMREFAKITDSLHDDYLKDLAQLGYFQGGVLTLAGVQYLKEMAIVSDIP